MFSKEKIEDLLNDGFTQTQINEFEMKEVYSNHGYANRSEYLQDLANEHDVEIEEVVALAELLGPSEDFDGLVSSVEDFHY